MAVNPVSAGAGAQPRPQARKEEGAQSNVKAVQAPPEEKKPDERKIDAPGSADPKTEEGKTQLAIA